MSKVALFPPLLVAACLMAGLYGALHNQVSYTVSPDYFHAYKFQQFGIPEALQGRVGASIVGWHASWWMGLFIGVPVSLVGLILPGWKMYLGRCLVAFVVVAGTALLLGLAALVYASCTISDATLPALGYPAGVDRVAFARAGTMHSFSYLGGFLGILTGSLYLIVERVRRARRSSCPGRQHDSPGVPGSPPAPAREPDGVEGRASRPDDGASSCRDIITRRTRRMDGPSGC